MCYHVWYMLYCIRRGREGVGGEREREGGRKREREREREREGGREG